MQSSIPKFRQNSFVSEKPGYSSEKLKILFLQAETATGDV